MDDPTFSFVFKSTLAVVERTRDMRIVDAKDGTRSRSQVLASNIRRKVSTSAISQARGRGILRWTSQLVWNPHPIGFSRMARVVTL